MDRRIWLTLGFLLLLFITCLIAGGIALFIGPTFGGVGTAIAPDFHFNLVSDWVSPEGSEFTYEELRYSYHEPGESTIEASCISDEGTEKQGQELKAIGLIMLVYSLSCFLPLLLIGLVVSVVMTFFLSKLIPKPEDSQERY